eukprot:CAMPEP_0179004488 /NCGR_PEP_ID=MMETSP0795-20121207/13334_1 /TAXON_ID=88552 /ORGANISM="Amoebophrya sp., Strain Ameob2" /LENGTH=807 /DNA_ID=CAMNT_0020698759 /DNA_START=269 /DNA_END=2692 /DNA_ORIENTATION=+
MRADETRSAAATPAGARPRSASLKQSTAFADRIEPWGGAAGVSHLPSDIAPFVDAAVPCLEESDVAAVKFTIDNVQPQRSLENVTVSWTSPSMIDVVPANIKLAGGGPEDTRNWVGVYSPTTSKHDEFVDYLYVEGKNGINRSSFTFRLLNMRDAYELRYIRGNDGRCLGKSDSIAFANPLLEPTQVHLSLAGRFPGDTAMWVSWNSGTEFVAAARAEGSSAVKTPPKNLPTVEFRCSGSTCPAGSNEKSSNSNYAFAVASSTHYDASDMCGAPSNVTSPNKYRHVGFFHSVLVEWWPKDLMTLGASQDEKKMPSRPEAIQYRVFQSADVKSDWFTFATPVEDSGDAHWNFIAYADHGAEWGSQYRAADDFSEQGTHTPGADVVNMNLRAMMSQYEQGREEEEKQEQQNGQRRSPEAPPARTSSLLAGARTRDQLAPSSSAAFSPGAAGALAASPSTTATSSSLIPRLALHFGDLAYAWSVGYIWELWQAQLQTTIAARMPYMVSVGNHEYDYFSRGSDCRKDPSNNVPNKSPLFDCDFVRQDPRKDFGFHPRWGNYGDDSKGECAVPVVHRFPNPPPSGHGIFWYSFDMTNVHVIQLSSEHDYRKGSIQHEWLAADLKAAAKAETRRNFPWIVVTAHRPAYNSDKFMPDYKVGHHMVDELDDLLKEHQVNLFLAGHYHEYERTWPAFKHKRVKESLHAKKKKKASGTVHITIGSAGAWLDDTNESVANDWSAVKHRTFGYLRLHVKGREGLRVDFHGLPEKQLGTSNTTFDLMDTVEIEPWVREEEEDAVRSQQPQGESEEEAIFI